MTRTWTLLLSVLVTVSTTARTTDPLTVHFPLASANINAAALEQLHEQCVLLNGTDIEKIVLVGHTDIRGNAAYNKELSERRAKAIQMVLENDCGVKVPMEIEWNGESAPLSSGQSEEDHARDRRVEVIVHYAADRNVNAPVASDQANSSTGPIDDPVGTTNCAEVEVKYEISVTYEPVSALLPAPHLHVHQQVRALFPAIDRPCEHFIVDPTKGITLTTIDGVVVHIGANSLTYADGSPIEGPVDISYRSFSEPFEIIASGIRMHLQQETGVEHFETAGMYELYASANGREVTTVSGTTMVLERPVAPVLDQGFVGWQLDANNGEWIPDNGLAQVPATIIQPVLIGTKATGRYFAELNDIESKHIPDSTRYSDRRSSSNYCFLTACDTTNMSSNWAKRRNRYTYDKSIPQISVKGYKGSYDRDRILFTVLMDTKHQFPEWSRMSGKVWEYVGPDSRSAFKQLYGRKHYYQDIDLVMEPGTDNGSLRLKEQGEWQSFPVSAHWERETRNAQARWDSNLSSFKKGMNKREHRFNRSLEQEVAHYHKQTDNRHAKAWQKAARDMDKVEDELALNEWITYADLRRPRTFNSDKMRDDLKEVATTFGIANFGVYNIDRIMKMPTQQDVLVNTHTPDGKPFRWVTAYGVLKNENSVITYWSNNETKGTNMLVARGEMKALFFVDMEGNIARADVSPLNQRTRRANVIVLPMEEPESIEELRASN